MSDVAECQDLIRDLFPKSLGNVGTRVRAAATRLGWRFSRTNDIWYAQARRIDAFEKEQLKQLEAKRQAAAERRISRDEYSRLRDRIARLEAALAISDEEHSGPHRDALQQSMGGFRGVDRPGARKGE